MQTNISNDALRFSVAWFLQRFLLAPGLRVFTRLANRTEIVGAENLDELRDESFLVCPNHTSAWDIWAGFEVGFSAMRSYFANDTYMCGLGAIERLGPWPVRTFCLSAGVLPVDRSQGLDQYAVQDVLRLFEQKAKRVACLVYPEGTRSKTGRLASKFKAGIGWIQAHTQAPVVPVYQMGWDHLPAVGRTLRIVIGKPMRFDDLAGERENPGTWIEIATRIMKAIRDLELACNPEAVQPRLDAAQSGWLADPEKWASTVRDLRRPLTFVEQDGEVGLLCGPQGLAAGDELPGASIRLRLPATAPGELGAPAFRSFFGTGLAVAAGVPEQGIASTALTAALGETGALALHGLDFLDGPELAAEIRAVKESVADRPWAGCLRYLPHGGSRDEERFALCREEGVPALLVSGYVRATADMLAYRYGALPREEGSSVVPRPLLVRVGHVDLARHFAAPAPADLLDELVAAGRLDETERALASTRPMADALVIEGDLLRGGTRRDLAALLPAVAAALRELQRPEILLGAAGELCSPEAIEGAFATGADFVVLSDPFQLVAEAGGAPARKELLGRLQPADVTTVPSHEYLEADWRVHVARFGSPFAARALRLEKILHDVEEGRELPAKERSFLEGQILEGTVEEAFDRHRAFLERWWPDLIARSAGDTPLRLALLVRRYLRLSQTWGSAGDEAHKLDWQLRCGPGLGAFNVWRANGPLADGAALKAGEVLTGLLEGAAVAGRLASMRAVGLSMPSRLRPVPAPGA